MELQGKKRVIIMGGAASGKDHMKTKLVLLGLEPDVSVTTRPLRDGETNGIDYHFVSPFIFNDLIINKRLVQYQEFNGNMYGTFRDSTADVFIMNASGIKQLTDEYLHESLVVFMDIPEELRKQRLVLRGDTTDKIEKRLVADRIERNNIRTNTIDIIIVNPSFNITSIEDLWSYRWIKTNGMATNKWIDKCV
jgi:guanylate kinase